ncbi:hypothetical protein JOQ06_023108 [Pogonophryne albipinna]|uniref:Uncharacterized protein n=1 Tax=Pogonophryne albipinna TaxID=1090488 RepID=A0AAD6FTZ8_9TELE|nr:hypothetical protein JOQ06_023108 [Pogonophryne albipinna]
MDKEKILIARAESSLAECMSTLYPEGPPEWLRAEQPDTALACAQTSTRPSSNITLASFLCCQTDKLKAAPSLSTTMSPGLYVPARGESGRKTGLILRVHQTMFTSLAWETERRGSRSCRLLNMCENTATRPALCR